MVKKQWWWGEQNLEKVGRAMIPRFWTAQLKGYIKTAGLEEVPYRFFGFVVYLAILLAVLTYAFPPLRIFSTLMEYGPVLMLLLSTCIIALMVVLYIVLFMILLKLYLDIVIHKRKKNVEEYLPDMLQQASANIRAGMTIDKALWFSVRPKYGILAAEVEFVAKKTLGGVDFTDALKEFGERFDSPTLKRAISLLINGMEAGGETGNLLNKISEDIQETKIMKKEMAANLKTYAIFISFATIIAAPLLFSLSFQLLTVVQDITGSISLPKSGGTFGLMMSLSGDSISLRDFRIFAILSLVITSFFSSVIVGIIQKGNIKDSLRYIPIFIGTTLLLFFIVSHGLGMLLPELL